MVEDEIIAGVGYEAVSAWYTDFAIENYSIGRGAVDNVAAIKMTATDTIPAGTKVKLSDPSFSPLKVIYYTFEQTVQNGDVVMWIDSRIDSITNCDDLAYWQMEIIKADDTGWYAPPIAFTFMREV